MGDHRSSVSTYGLAQHQCSSQYESQYEVDSQPASVAHALQPKTLGTGSMKLDIACGQNKKEGFLGVDIAGCPGVDVIHDLTVYPWPFEDNSIEEAHCSHYIEHVQDLFKFFDELYRILKPGAKIEIIAPYGKSDRAWQDPTHIRPILEATFLYANKTWRETNKLDHYPIKCDFDYGYGYNLNPPWNMKAQEALHFALNHYWNVASDIHVTMTKRE